MKISVFWFTNGTISQLARVVDEFKNSTFEAGKWKYYPLTSKFSGDGAKVNYEAPDLDMAISFSVDFKKFLWRNRRLVHECAINPIDRDQVRLCGNWQRKRNQQGGQSHFDASIPVTA